MINLDGNLIFVSVRHGCLIRPQLWPHNLQTATAYALLLYYCYCGLGLRPVCGLAAECCNRIWLPCLRTPAPFASINWHKKQKQQRIAIIGYHDLATVDLFTPYKIT